jgi:hypothetical protein
MTITPYPWQRPYIAKGVDVLKQHPFLLNASDTGVGKTVMTLATLAELGLRTLIIAPKAVHTAWRRTAAAMNAEGYIHDVINIERLQYRNPYYVDKRWHAPELVVIDEIHRGASGPKSKTTRIIAELRAYPQTKVLAQSATAADNPLNLRAIGFLARLHDFNNQSFYSWARRYGCHTRPNLPGIFPPTGKSAIKHMLALHGALAPLTVRARIADIEDFPTTQIQSQLFDLDPEETKEIQTAYAEAWHNIQHRGCTELVEQLRARQRTEVVKARLLAELVRDTVAEQHSAVVFLNFHASREILADILHDLNPTQLHGKQPVDVRRANIDRFQDNATAVMIAMIQAGGVGVDLHDSKRIRPRRSFITPCFHAKDIQQTLGRVHRSGGTKTIQTFVLAADTVEERVHRSLSAKLHNISTLNDGDLI